MNKTLKGLLRELDKDAIVAIGTDGGSGFVYIGKAGNVDLILKCFAEYRNGLSRDSRKSKEHLKSLIEASHKYGDIEEDFEKILEQALIITKQLETVNRYIQLVDHYKPVLERGVLENYHKDVDDCEAIIIPGLESGRFWFREEFESKYKDYI